MKKFEGNRFGGVKFDTGARRAVSRRVVRRRASRRVASVAFDEK